ncbi:MAG TPA: vitamin K epoxide reductase family protein [Candidatus Nanoarchaeia archaeon]|nr:vitamin K epoxide reductase family protein [Candidatus Nanoarchaeia archaeon]
MQNSLLILPIIGFLLSLYSFYVERKTQKDSNYKAVCDISDRMSCSKTFTSGYGKLFFGISNGVAGIAFYILVIALNIFGMTKVIFYLSILSLIGSVYLAYVLNFKVKTVCMVCYSIYLVNILLLVFSYRLL